MQELLAPGPLQGQDFGFMRVRPTGCGGAWDGTVCKKENQVTEAVCKVFHTQREGPDKDQMRVP